MKAIMLTGYPTLETAKEAVRLGANEYCVKPVEKTEIENRVAQLVSV
jgi:ActR/RegA family two-component response regulator